MSIKESMDEAKDLENLQQALLKAVYNFTNAPIEGLYWEITELMSEYCERYLDHHQIELSEVPDCAEFNIPEEIPLPANVIPFKRPL